MNKKFDWDKWHRKALEDSKLENQIFNSIPQSSFEELYDYIAELEESDKHWAGNVKVCMQLIERYESDIAELEAENAELKGRAENAEQMVSRLLEVGSALEAQAYDAWIKDGMLDFPAAKDWELLINEIKETKKESEK